MIYFGSAVNGVLILIGCLVGSLLRRGIPEKLTKGMLTAMGLCVLYIGIDGLSDGENLLVTILSMALGALIGEWADIDRATERFGEWVRRKVGGSDNRVGEGFVTCSLLFCIGAMAILGSFESAGSESFSDHRILLSKAVIDGITGLVMATTLGIGCALSALTVFVYQGALTTVFWFLLSSVDIAQYLYVIHEINAVGSLLIVAIGLNMLGITKIKVANLIPAMFLPLLIAPLLARF